MVYQLSYCGWPIALLTSSGAHGYFYLEARKEWEEKKYSELTPGKVSSYRLTKVPTTDLDYLKELFPQKVSAKMHGGAVDQGQRQFSGRLRL